MSKQTTDPRQASTDTTTRPVMPPLPSYADHADEWQVWNDDGRVRVCRSFEVRGGEYPPIGDGDDPGHEVSLGAIQDHDGSVEFIVSAEAPVGTQLTSGQARAAAAHLIAAADLADEIAGQS